MAEVMLKIEWHGTGFKDKVTLSSQQRSRMFREGVIFSDEKCVVEESQVEQLKS